MKNYILSNLPVKCHDSQGYDKKEKIRSCIPIDINKSLTAM